MCSTLFDNLLTFLIKTKKKCCQFPLPHVSGLLVCSLKVQLYVKMSCLLYNYALIAIEFLCYIRQKFIIKSCIILQLSSFKNEL